jgi:hypothetical protein
MLFVTTVFLEMVHVYATTSADAWKLLQGAIGEGTVTDSLRRLTDLGIASASGTGSTQS